MLSSKFIKIKIQTVGKRTEKMKEFFLQKKKKNVFSAFRLLTLLCPANEAMIASHLVAKKMDKFV